MFGAVRAQERPNCRHKKREAIRRAQLHASRSLSDVALSWRLSPRTSMTVAPRPMPEVMSWTPSFVTVEGSVIKAVHARRSIDPLFGVKARRQNPFFGVDARLNVVMVVVMLDDFGR